MRFRSCLMLALAAMLTFAGCEDINRDTAPVQLIATSSINVTTVDLATPGAASDVADILIRAASKNDDSNPVLEDVKLSSYRVSYIRTDGGVTVPNSFVVPVNQFLATDGGTVDLDNFRAFDVLALSQAPFAALLPQNGGVDPETGRRVVEMDVRVEVFGETLAGANLYTTTRFPVTFCYGCLGA